MLSTWKHSWYLHIVSLSVCKNVLVAIKLLFNIDTTLFQPSCAHWVVHVGILLSTKARVFFTFRFTGIISVAVSGLTVGMNCFLLYHNHVQRPNNKKIFCPDFIFVFSKTRESFVGGTVNLNIKKF